MTSNKGLRSKQLQRCLFSINVDQRRGLCEFPDASEAGYSALVFGRCRMRHDSYDVRILLAMARVIPSKSVSVSRLALSAEGGAVF